MENFLKKELVMFYNVENLFSPDPKPTHFLDPTISGLRNWDERKYQNKLRKIANVFRLIEEKEEVLPMIVGLCEVNNEEVLQDLIQQEPLQNYDFVLTGGELAACVLADAIIRLLPGVLNDEQSALTDSFQDDLLSPPIYTKPEDYKGMKVPEILLSGNFGKIEDWRHEKALEITKQKRPDLLKDF